MLFFLPFLVFVFIQTSSKCLYCILGLISLSLVGKINHICISSKKDLSLCAVPKHYSLWVRANWVIICVSIVLLLCFYHCIYSMCLFNFQISILNFIEFKLGYILALETFIVICSRQSMCLFNWVSNSSQVIPMRTLLL